MDYRRFRRLKTKDQRPAIEYCPKSRELVLASFIKCLFIYLQWSEYWTKVLILTRQKSGFPTNVALRFPLYCNQSQPFIHVETSTFLQWGFEKYLNI